LGRNPFGIGKLSKSDLRPRGTAWEPTATDFLTDLRGALKGGAAGWCFHNGGQRTTGNQQPRRSFDLRAKRLLDQLDEEETKVFQGGKSVLFEQRKED